MLAVLKDQMARRSESLEAVVLDPFLARLTGRQLMPRSATFSRMSRCFPHSILPKNVI